MISLFIYIPFYAYRTYKPFTHNDESILLDFFRNFSFSKISLNNLTNDFSYFSLISDYSFNKSWINDFLVQNHNIESSKKCPLCNFQPPNKKKLKNIQKSTRRDLIMTIYVKRLYGMIVLARSLRTTGCQASIIYFVDSSIHQQILNDLQSAKLYENCGVTIINYGEPPEPLKSVVNYRFILFSEFMKRFQSNYDRVIIVDGFDTVFQSDPFLNEWNPNVIYLALENNRNSITRGWLDRLYPNENLYDVLSKTIINNGVIAGFSQVMFAYLNFYIRSYDWNKWTDTLDQALINCLVYRNKFDNAGIKIELIHPGKGFLASIYNSHGSTSQQKLGLFDPINLKVYPSLIHKFSEPRQFASNVYAQCPRLNWQKKLNEYIRGLSAFEMDLIDNKN